MARAMTEAVSPQTLTFLASCIRVGVDEEIRQR